MTDDEIIKLAHREAWRYRKSRDPSHSDTYTFNCSTLLEFARKLVAMSGAEAADVKNPRPAGMPDGYTDAQKAAAFDVLWERCGNNRGDLNTYVTREVGRSEQSVDVVRVPVYRFEILAVGDGMISFRDALHEAIRLGQLSADAG